MIEFAPLLLWLVSVVALVALGYVAGEQRAYRGLGYGSERPFSSLGRNGRQRRF